MKTRAISAIPSSRTIRPATFIATLLLRVHALLAAGVEPPGLDQMQTVADPVTATWAIGGQSGQKLAQVFTAGRDGRLIMVGLPVAGRGELIIQVQGVVAGRPNSVVLAEEVVDGMTLPDFSADPSGFRHIRLRSPPSLTRGESYALVLAVRDPSESHSFGLLPAPPGNVYPGGDAYADARPGEPGWDPLGEPAHDLAFQTFLSEEEAGVRRAARILFTLAEPGRVSLAIYDAAGNQVRTLAAGVSKSAGSHVMVWDGVHQDGWAMPPGTYTWKLLVNNGLEADLITVLGVNPKAGSLDHNPGPEPWSWWLGNHTGPSSVTTGSDGVFVGAEVAEGTLTFVKLSQSDLTELWSVNSALTGNWFGPTAMAWAGPDVICLNRLREVLRIDARTGLGGFRKILQLPWPTDVERDRAMGNVTLDMDADATSIVISDYARNKLTWYNSTTLEVTRELDVERPGKLAIGEDAETVYLIVDGALRQVTRDGVQPNAIAPDELVRPTAVAYDRARNQILVANGAGPDANPRNGQIIVLNQDGTLVSRVGREGGRINGPFIRNAFRNVLDLAPDGSGGFYLIEDGLRRLAHVNAGGAVNFERFGGAPFYASASASPQRPEEVWLAMSTNTMVCFQVDYDFSESRPDPEIGSRVLDDRAEWSVKSVYEISDYPGRPTFVNLGGDGPWGWRVISWRGHTYFVNESFCQVMRLDEGDQQIKPVASAGLVMGLGHSWSDRVVMNGRKDPGEDRTFRIGPPLPSGISSRAGFDDDLNITLGFNPANHFDFGGAPYVRLRNRADPASLVPEWDIDETERPGFVWPDPFPIVKTVAVQARRDGSVFLLAQGAESPNPDPSPPRGGGDASDVHPGSWPACGISQVRIAGFSPLGVHWKTSKHVSPGFPPEFQIRSPAALPGFVKDCLIVGDRDAFGATAWTADGLFAGNFLEAHLDDGTPADNQIPDGQGTQPVSFPRGNDWQVGSRVIETVDGKVLWMALGRNVVPIYRIRGWESFRRQTGALQLDGPASFPDRNGSGLLGSYFAGVSMAEPPVARRIDRQIWFVNNPGSSVGLHAGDWQTGPVAGVAANAPFSVRWEGTLVAPFSEPYWFRVYNAYHRDEVCGFQIGSSGASLGAARLWLNGKLLLDHWTPESFDLPWEVGPFHLKAGEKYQLRLDYAHPAGGAAGAQLSLVWSSDTLEWTRVPQSFLYPEPPGRSLPAVSLRVVSDAGGDLDAREAGEDPVTVRFVLDTAPDQPLVIRYALNGAAGREDYWPLSGRIVIPVGRTEADLVIRPVDDSMTEGNESVVVSVLIDEQYELDGTAGEIRFVIHDNDNLLTDGLLAYFPLDDADGLVVRDAARESYHGIIKTGFTPRPAWVPDQGRIGGALLFSGGESVNFVNFPDLWDFTWACWLKTGQLDLGVGTISFRLVDPVTSVPGGENAFSFGAYAGRYASCMAGWGVIGAEIPVIADGRWHHIAHTRVHYDTADGVRAAQYLYIDGEVRMTAAAHPGVWMTPRMNWGTARVPLTTGCVDGLESRMVGTLDDFRLYGRALSGEQVAQLARFAPASIENSFPAWISRFGLADDQSDRQADPDADGLSNLAEYAFGGDPSVPDAARVAPESLPPGSAAAESVCIRYPRAIGAGLDYRVEWSVDLDRWAAASGLPGFWEERVEDVDGTPQIRACFDSGLAASVFLRVAIVERP